MADLLTDEEREALQDSIQSTGRSRPHSPAVAPKETPVALIADDQATEKARPAALRIAERWATQLQRLFPPVCGAKVEVTVDQDVETDPDEILKELTANWLGMVRSGKALGGALVAASGTMIPELAARLLGGIMEFGPHEKIKPPTSATLRVFDKIGQQLVLGLIQAIEQEQGIDARAIPAPQSAETWPPLVERTPLLMVRLNVKGDAEGVIRLVAPPEVVSQQRRVAAAPPTDPELVRMVLAEVPVDFSVELGSMTMRASDFAGLRPGAIVRLDSLVGDPLPVRVGGRLHAFGSAVLLGDVIAVQIGDRAEMARAREQAHE